MHAWCAARDLLQHAQLMADKVGGLQLTVQHVAELAGQLPSQELASLHPVQAHNEVCR